MWVVPYCKPLKYSDVWIKPRFKDCIAFAVPHKSLGEVVGRKLNEIG